MFIAFILACAGENQQTTVVPEGTPATVVAAVPAGHTFTFKNDCSETLWVGSFGQNGTPALNGGGWKMEAGASVEVQVPVGNSGRVWARTKCAFGEDGNCPEKGVNCCATGGCLGSVEQTFGLQCTGTGVPPATLQEWTLDAPSGNGPIDYYDASLVDGWSVPMKMTPVQGTFNTTPDPGIGTWWCEADGCTGGLPVCPDAYKVDGSPLSCWSPCMAATNANSADATKLCCTCSRTDSSISCGDAACAGGYGCSPYTVPPNPADMTCDPWNKDTSRAWDATAISYIDAVKQAYPKVYSWQFDDTKATFNCRKTDGLVDYVIEFCPGVPAAER
jgi:hypothetical protein